jgi:hypothetical protein
MLSSEEILVARQGYRFKIKGWGWGVGGEQKYKELMIIRQIIIDNKITDNYRFIIEDNIPLTAARLALVSSIQKILKGGFDIIGITPLSKM